MVAGGIRGSRDRPWHTWHLLGFVPALFFADPWGLFLYLFYLTFFAACSSPSNCLFSSLVRSSRLLTLSTTLPLCVQCGGCRGFWESTGYRTLWKAYSNSSNCLSGNTWPGEYRRPWISLGSLVDSGRTLSHSEWQARLILTNDSHSLTSVTFFAYLIFTPILGRVVSF